MFLIELLVYLVIQVIKKILLIPGYIFVTLPVFFALLGWEKFKGLKKENVDYPPLELGE